MGPRAWPGAKISNTDLCLVWTLSSSLDHAHGTERKLRPKVVLTGRVLGGQGGAQPLPPFPARAGRELRHHFLLFGHPPMDQGLESEGH